MALKHIIDFIKVNYHTNMILLSVLHCHNLMNSSYVSNNMNSFNRKLMDNFSARLNTRNRSS